jgi:hypothetical protein
VGLCVWIVAAVSGADARDARSSELLTPADWGAEQAAAVSGDELLTPAGWAMTSEIAWDRTQCSELLIPADWSGLPARRSAR